MKDLCEHCVHAKYSKDGGIIVKGRTMIIQNGPSYRCTAKVIAKMDLTGDEMYCSSFREKEESGDGAQE